MQDEREKMVSTIKKLKKEYKYDYESFMKIVISLYIKLKEKWGYIFLLVIIKVIEFMLYIKKSNNIMWSKWQLFK